MTIMLQCVPVMSAELDPVSDWVLFTFLQRTLHPERGFTFIYSTPPHVLGNQE